MASVAKKTAAPKTAAAKPENKAKPKKTVDSPAEKPVAKPVEKKTAAKTTPTARAKLNPSGEWPFPTGRRP
jgi:hypothetical protein